MNEMPLRSPLDLVRWISWAQLRANEAWCKERGLSRAQALVLGYLVREPGAIQRELADVTRTSAASVTSLLKGLENRALVERRTEAGNERSKRVFVTEAGAALVDGFADDMHAANEDILSPLTTDERTELGRLLGKITAELPPPHRD